MDEITYEGYAGHWAIKANTKRKPAVLNRDKTPITDIDDIVYPGCYVNASIEIYAMDNQWGKRVGCQLNGLQFHSDGEPFVKGGLDDDDFSVEGEAVGAKTAFDDETTDDEPNPFDDDIAF